MATEKQITANRANAKRSSGPKSAAGQLKSSRNAYRHGLSLPLSADPQAQANIMILARAIAGKGATPDQLIAAMMAAEAQLDLIRIRTARVEACPTIGIDLNAISLRRVCALDRCMSGWLGADGNTTRQFDDLEGK
jgi:hypothetical protein